MLSREERQKIMDENPPEISFIHWTNLYFDWDWQGCGFGQLSISFDDKDCKLTAMNECMGRESIRKFLHAYADYIADRVILLDFPDDVPPIDMKAEYEQAAERQKEFLAKRKIIRRDGEK